MDPLEIIRTNADEETLAKVEKLIENGATWTWSNYTNEAALEIEEDSEGLRQFVLSVDFDEEDFELYPLFGEK